MENETQLLDTLQNWDYLKHDLAKRELELQEKSYKVTTSFSEATSFGSGSVSSKVEDYVFSLIEKKNEIREIKDKMKLCMWALRKADLTKTERLTIQYTCSKRSLLQLSKELNIAQARIYRIRDRAVKKMFSEIQSGVKIR